MNKWTSAVGLALCVSLSGCMTTQTIDVGGRRALVIEPSFLPSNPAFDPHNPIVFVTRDRIVVDQEPLRPTRQESDGTYIVNFYVVTVPAASGQYEFPNAQAIQTTTAGAPTFNCTLVRPRAMSCWFNAPDAAHKVWKYAVTVVLRDTGGTIIQTRYLDPSVAMD
ncbi:MAG: hypothetical protein ABI981_08770 [Betaproteobacteria bacterium]